MGTPPARQFVWSAAHWITSRPCRSDQVSRVQPEPPAWALAQAAKAERQPATLPKSRSSAAARSPSASPEPPSPSKYTSCRIIELAATSSSRFSPLISNTGAVAQSRPWSRVSIAFRRRTAPP